MIKNICIFIGPHKPDAARVVLDLRDWCKKRNLNIFEIAARDGFDEKIELPEETDLVVVLGGDGTMLGAARIIGERQIPVLGVNFGRLGYLTEYTLEELIPALENLCTEHITVDSRIMFDVDVLRGGGVIFTERALNEAVISHGVPRKMIDFDCFVDNLFLNSFRADGIIISTPTGSTAYSLSAGGPIIHPNMSAMVITPICPHMLSNRPVVISGESIVDVKFGRSNIDMILTVDGRPTVAIERDDVISIRRSSVPFNLVRPSNRDYFEVLRTKLKWGIK